MAFCAFFCCGVQTSRICQTYNPKTNMEPENRPSQKEIDLPNMDFPVLCSSILGSNLLQTSKTHCWIKDWSYCWWFRNPAFTSRGWQLFSHYLQGFRNIPGGCLGFLLSTVFLFHGMQESLTVKESTGNPLLNFNNLEHPQLIYIPDNVTAGKLNNLPSLKNRLVFSNHLCFSVTLYINFWHLSSISKLSISLWLTVLDSPF